MKELTEENFAEYWPEIRHLFDEDWQFQGDVVVEELEFPEEEDLREHVVDAIPALNKKLASILNENATKEAASKTEESKEAHKESPKTTKSKQPKEKNAKEKPTKQPKEKPAKQPKFDSVVNKVSIQVRLAARFVKLQGKNFTSETKDEARKILGALQKAILNHEIRKEGYGALSAYAAEMRKMQDKLVKMCNAPANASSVVNIADIEDFRRIARAEGSATSVNAMRSYVRVATKPNPTKKEAETALNKIDKVIAANEQGSYKDTIAEIRDALAAFISGDTSTIATMNQTLDGIRHVCGPDCTTHKKKA